MLDVRTLWLLDSTIRIGVARGGGGGGLEGLALPLPPCGQLTRCFSAVADLLVLVKCVFMMVQAKNYESMSTFVKIMQKKLWPLFFRTRCMCATAVFIRQYQLGAVFL